MALKPFHRLHLIPVVKLELVLLFLRLILVIILLSPSGRVLWTDRVDLLAACDGAVAALSELNPDGGVRCTALGAQRCGLALARSRGGRERGGGPGNRGGGGVGGEIELARFARLVGEEVVVPVVESNKKC